MNRAPTSIATQRAKDKGQYARDAAAVPVQLMPQVALASVGTSRHRFRHEHTVDGVSLMRWAGPALVEEWDGSRP